MTTKLAISQFIYPHVVIGLMIVVLLTATTEFIIQLICENHTARQQQIAIDKSKAIRAQIEGEFNAMFYLSAGLMAHVATHPQISNEEFSTIASEIIATGRNIRNIALARNNVITYIYPLKGNEAALGLDYTKNTTQWPAVEKAIELKRTIVAGPLDLVQGGRGIIIRTPIFTRKSLAGHIDSNPAGYWGLASLVLESNGFFTTTEFSETQEGFQFALRGKDGLGVEGEMILGSADVFNRQPILTPINLQHGEWLLAASPISGWSIKPTQIWHMRLLGWFIAIAFGALVSSLSISRKINRDLAFYDPLTTLPNRRLLDDRMQQVMVYSQRYKKSFGLFFIDLDDFKCINDKLGHRVGDALLVEAARRMLLSVRASDTVARTGGDEFLILVNDINEAHDMCHIRAQLTHNLLSAANIEGHEMTISASIGYAIYPEDEITLDGLANIADQRMYEEKSEKKSKD
ncbi:diguanylate cyclase domain-containing protein [Thalassotalea fusca]